MRFILKIYNIYSTNIKKKTFKSFDKKIHFKNNLNYSLIKTERYNVFFYTSSCNFYKKYNTILQFSKKNYISFQKWIQIPKFFGNLKCYYLHGMGYKCNNAINSIFFSVGKSQWDSLSLPKGSFCYTTSRKSSWRKTIIRNSMNTVCKDKSTINLLLDSKKKKIASKKRKLRTRVKLLRNYHGLLFIYTMSKHQLNRFGWLIQKIRTPNVYTGKGIHYYKDTFKPQERKLKSFFYKK